MTNHSDTVGDSSDITLVDVINHMNAGFQRLERNLADLEKRLSDRIERNREDILRNREAIESTNSDLLEVGEDTIRIRQHVGMPVSDEIEL